MAASSNARMWRSADLGGLELFRATADGSTFAPHAHEEFFVALAEDGVAAPTYRGARHVIRPGELIVLNPEEAHAGGPPPGHTWSYRAIYPGPVLMRRILAEFHAGPERAPHFSGDVRDRTIRDLLRRYHHLAESASTSALEREEVLLQALGLLVGRHAHPAPSPRLAGKERRAVRLSREYIDARASEQFTLESLSAHAGLSLYHLCRVFRAATGLTPHAYQTQIRIRRAKSLLSRGVPIARVAADTGFYDQAHLTRQFKRIVGVTPGRYV